MKQLVLATHNQGKVNEFRDMLGPLVEDLKSAADFNLPEPEETGTTFVENALIKARAAASATGLPCLADDSGLAVEALKGAPGIYSARWSGPGKDFSVAMQKVHDELKGNVEGQGARFVVVLALVYPDGREELFEGKAEGNLTWPPRGAQGHGYDPIFVPAGGSQTFAEIDPAAKNTMSHRARAVEELTAYLANELQVG